MIKLENAACGYGGQPVLRNISLKMDSGEVLLITGPNGAGKSTLLRVLAGVLHPETGTLDYGWPHEKDPRQSIGYLPDSLSIYRSMSVRDICRLHWNAFGVKPSSLPLMEKASIGWTDSIEDLSVGQRTLFQLMLVLSTGPKLILVDEVLHSVDAYLRRLALETLVETLADSGPALVMVSHDCRWIEYLVSRVVFLSSGSIAFDETVDSLIQGGERKLSDALAAGMSNWYEGSN